MYDTCLGNSCTPAEICEETMDGGEFRVKEQGKIQKLAPFIFF